MTPKISRILDNEEKDFKYGSLWKDCILPRNTTLAYCVYRFAGQVWRGGALADYLRFLMTVDRIWDLADYAWSLLTINPESAS
jgi:hypothetical protein